MAKKVVTSEKTSPAGPYSPGIEAGGFLFVAGQGARDPKTGKTVEGGVKAQTRAVLDKVKAIVEADGLTMEDVVTVSVFMRDIKDFSKMNEVYRLYFPKDPPARTTIQAELPDSTLLVEINAIAYRGK